MSNAEFNAQLNVAVAEKVFGLKGVGYYGPRDRTGLHTHYRRYDTPEKANVAYLKYWDGAKPGHFNWAEDGGEPSGIKLCSWKLRWGPIFVPNYAGFIADAWLVVTRIQEADVDFWLGSEWDEQLDRKSWEAQFMPRGAMHGFGVSGDTPCQAICLAALQALEK